MPPVPVFLAQTSAKPTYATYMYATYTKGSTLYTKNNALYTKGQDPETALLLSPGLALSYPRLPLAGLAG